MTLLLIIADDFTGALDTGVQFAAHGIRTRMVVDTNVDFNANDASVLVVDTETRHLPADRAYDIVADLTRRACTAGVRYIYKKTDSALRGNVGAELSAVLKASGLKSLPFLPAFPQIGRVTKNGIHYINDVPVNESLFGKDPFEPVKHAAVTELIVEQCAFPVKSFPALKEQEPVPNADGIQVYDGSTAEDLFETGKRLADQGRLSIMAGCAGFGAVLPELLELASQSEGQIPMPALDPRLLVICGSVNPITLSQLNHAEKAGFTRMRLTPRQKLEPDYWRSADGKEQLKLIEKMLSSSSRCIIETNDENGSQPTAAYAKALGMDLEALRVRISGSLGVLVKEIFTSPHLGTLLLTGGDTLLQCMNCVGVRELEPVCEMEKGVVLARFTYSGCTRYVITKSGGFGQESLLTDLADALTLSPRSCEAKAAVS